MGCVGSRSKVKKKESNTKEKQENVENKEKMENRNNIKNKEEKVVIKNIKGRIIIKEIEERREEVGGGGRIRKIDGLSECRTKESIPAECQIINNIDYGIPLWEPPNLWLSKGLLTPKAMSIEEVTGDIPNILTLPTCLQLESLLEAGSESGNVRDYLVNTFRASPGEAIISSEKSYPECTNHRDPKSWMFKGIIVLPGGEITITDISTYNYPPIIRRLIFKDEGSLRASQPSPYILSPSLYSAAHELTFQSAITTNITNIQWDFGDQDIEHNVENVDVDEDVDVDNTLENVDNSLDNSLDAQSFIVRHKYKRRGLYRVRMTLEFLGNIKSIRSHKDINIKDEIVEGEREIVNGRDYGVPVLLGKQLWLNKDLEEISIKGENICVRRGYGPGAEGENCWLTSCESQHIVWKLPRREDIEELLEYAGDTSEQRFEYLTLPHGFRCIMNEDGFADYVTSDTHSHNNALSFSVIQCSKSVMISKCWKYPNSFIAYFSTRLMFNAQPLTQREKQRLGQEIIQVDPPSSIFSGQLLRFSSSLNTNITQYKWEFGDGGIHIHNTSLVQYIYRVGGNYRVKLTLNYMGIRQIDTYIDLNVKEKSPLGDDLP